MSHGVLKLGGAIFMLALAVVAARILSDPAPTVVRPEVVSLAPSRPEPARPEPTRPEPWRPEVAPTGQPVAAPSASLSHAALPPLPPASAMRMSAGDAPAALPVSREEPAPSAPGRLVADRPSGSGAVTEPPSANPVPAAAEPAKPAVAPAPSGVVPSTPVAPSAPAVTGKPSVAPVPEPQSPRVPYSGPTGKPSVAPVPEPVVVAPPVPVKPATPVSAEPAAKPGASTPAAKPADSATAKPAKPAPIVVKTSLPAKSGSNVVTAATLTLDGNTTVLRLQGNAPMQGKSFLLRQPERVVMDVEGLWKVEAPRPPDNRLVQSLRVGSQGTATRFVFDMRAKPSKAEVVKINGSTLELRIQ